MSFFVHDVRQYRFDGRSSLPRTEKRRRRGAPIVVAHTPGEAANIYQPGAFFKRHLSGIRFVQCRLQKKETIAVDQFPNKRFHNCVVSGECIFFSGRTKLLQREKQNLFQTLLYDRETTAVLQLRVIVFIPPEKIVQSIDNAGTLVAFHFYAQETEENGSKVKAFPILSRWQGRLKDGLKIRAGQISIVFSKDRLQLLLFEIGKWIAEPGRSGHIEFFHFPPPFRIFVCRSMISR